MQKNTKLSKKIIKDLDDVIKVWSANWNRHNFTPNLPTATTLILNDQSWEWKYTKINTNWVKRYAQMIKSKVDLTLPNALLSKLNNIISDS